MENPAGNRRGFQFSLRTMFVGMAVAAAILALWPFVEFDDVGGIGSEPGWRLSARFRGVLMVGIPVAIAWWYWRKYRDSQSQRESEVAE